MTAPAPPRFIPLDSPALPEAPTASAPDPPEAWSAWTIGGHRFRSAPPTYWTPPAIIEDTREQRPLPFHLLDPRDALPVIRGGLELGDYSAVGMEADLFIERKALPDLVGSVTHDRRRFEDELAAVFDDDRRTVHIYTTFSVVAIVISCLGLLGLSLFDIQRRRREIALRKVHGSTVSQIFGLLMKRYIIIMTTAFAVSIPLALWLINIYTADFASCAPIGIWIFLTVALLIGGISTGALYVQVRRAAHIPPAEAIAME